MTTSTCAINGVSKNDQYVMPPWHFGRICQYLLIVFTFVFSTGARSAEEPANANVIQARTDAATKMVLGIISYARWPVTPQVIRLCVVAPTNYAEGLFNPALMATQHPIKVERFPFASPAISSQCDAIYLGSATAEQRLELINRTQGHPILTISEDYSECATGSAFCLLVEDNQASFKVNMDALARTGVRVHPSVLQLARKKADGL
ncbi:membrane protein [Yersinia entomophaga]|uniref:Membrane protein n=1 Tax=Yersinia entomophaga TaxID=935293 RepID=A0ABN4PXC3_YERET|nr:MULTISPECIES: YfiR family protein [Yersinia]ANI30856.1 membrane protein [Yersinia entomophaga]OWF89026.1 hypothetical protein B4914_05810 [Yersinia entomophaga]